MSLDLGALDEATLAFLTERQFATLTNVRADGTPHVVPVRFTYEPETRLVRVITSGTSVKARLAARPGAVAAVCQVDGRLWPTDSRPATLSSQTGGTGPGVLEGPMSAVLAITWWPRRGLRRSWAARRVVAGQRALREGGRSASAWSTRHCSPSRSRSSWSVTTTSLCPTND